MSPILKQCIIPVAGIGKRWQPISNLYPKELLPIGNIPLLAYILFELVKAKINQVILVVSEEKKDYFVKFIDLIETSSDLKALNLDSLSFKIVLQEPLKNKYGLGAAVYSARGVFLNGNNSTHFALLLPDVLLGSSDYLKQMKSSLFSRHNNLIALNQVNPNEVSNYGIAKFTKESEINNKIESLIEKPEINQAPSNWAVLGRYLLSVEIFSALKNSTVGVGDEIQITDAINQLNDINQDITAFFYGDKLFDCGKVDGFIDANQNFNQPSFISNSTN